MSPAPKIIAFVSDAIWPYNRGGKEKRLYDISTRLAERGYDVHIYCMKWWGGPEKNVRENGVWLHGICPYIPLYSGRRRSIRQALLFAISTFRLFFFRFDLIDVDHMPFFQLFTLKFVTLIKRKPLIATWNEVWGLSYWRKYLGLGGFIAYLIERVSVYMPDRVLSISDVTAYRLRHWLHMRSPMQTIPCGVDIEKIFRVQPSKQKTDIVFVGRLLEHKRVDLLINAVSLLRRQKQPLRCLIVGEGPEKIGLQELVSQSGLDDMVEFHGSDYSDTDVYARIKSARLLVLPSVREGYGIIVIEALACGVPVVVVDHPDNAAVTLVQKDVGYISQESPGSLADTISHALSRRWDRTKLRRSAAPYSWNVLIDRIVSFYSA